MALYGAVEIAAAFIGHIPADLTFQYRSRLEVKYFDQANFPPQYDVEINFTSVVAGAHGVSSTFAAAVEVVGEAVLGHTELFGLAGNTAANFSWTQQQPYSLASSNAANIRQSAFPIAQFFGAIVNVVSSFEGAHYGSTGTFDDSVPVPVTGTAVLAHGPTITGTIEFPVSTTGSDKAFSYFPVDRRVSPDVAFRYSGGAANISPRNSFGGPVSNTSAKYAKSQNHTASTIPGVTITHAAKNPIGANGYLQYTAFSKTLTWTNHNGVVALTGLTSSGWYTVGSTVSGYLRLNVEFSLLSGADVGQTVAITEAFGTLFDNPASNEILSGSTEYRALYLVNESTSRMVDIVLTLLADTPSSLVYIGSSFLPVSSYVTPGSEGLSFVVFNHKTLTPPYSTSASATTAREQLVGLSPAGLPRFAYYPSDVSQSSDGVSIAVETQLQDRFDSTGKLDAVGWRNVLTWSSIPAGSMSSFWVKRILPPNPVVPVIETIDFDLSFTMI